MTQAAPAAEAVLRLLVKGFTPVELRLLEGAVRLSQRRPPRIDLVGGAEAGAADVVMIDATDPAAMQWAATQFQWLGERPVIWAGAKSARAGHMAIERHVKWPILPVLLYRALEEGPRRAASAPPPAAAARKILVVDDSLAARAHLRVLLERQGVDVVEADTAEAAIALAQSQPFACVLMDVLMPGMDGFEACRRIRAAARNGAAPPVVMLTSKSSPFDRVRGKMAGCDTYLTKPVEPQQLHDVVARLLGPGDAKPHPAIALPRLAPAAGA
jgi:two-component system cell cycle response regulator